MREKPERLAGKDRDSTARRTQVPREVPRMRRGRGEEALEILGGEEYEAVDVSLKRGLVLAWFPRAFTPG